MPLVITVGCAPRPRPASAPARPTPCAPDRARLRSLPPTFIIGAAALPPMSSKGWWIGMAVAAAVVYYGTYSFLPFK